VEGDRQGPAVQDPQPDHRGYSDAVLEYLVKNVGEDRIVMGSDYCFPIAYEQDGVMDALWMRWQTVFITTTKY
jgi:hypothetical protein